MKQLKYLLNLLTSFIPSALPKGYAQFNAWADSIIELASAELAEVPLDQKRYVLATMIVSLKPAQDRVSRRFFVKQLNMAASKQVASQVFQEVQETEKQKRMAEQAAKTSQTQAEATAAPVVVAPRGQGAV